MARAERLQQARKSAGYEGPGEAAAAMGGLSKFTYTQHENGLRGFPIDKAIQYANRFRVRLEWLLKGTGSMKDGQLVPVVGHVGAGAEVFPNDDPHPKGQGLEMVDAPPDGAADCVAVEIRGDSMHPLGDGWLIFYRRVQDGVPDNCVNKLCVVKVHEGPMLLKTLKRGRSPKLWTLKSWNADDRDGIRLEWAARVLDIRPR